MRNPDTRRFLRFIVTGAANTAITGALLLLLSGWMAIDVAYTIVYVIGLTFTTVVSARFVFRASLTRGSVGRFVAWYLCVYLLGVFTVEMATREWHSSHLMATLAVLVITVPLNYLGGSRAFGVLAASSRA